MKSLLMRFRHDILRALPLIISGAVIAWCGFYLLFGASSVFVLRALKIQDAQLASSYDTLHKERAKVEDRVVRLRPDTLDWDMVEQQALEKLGPAPATQSLKM